jgi:hypothetical protein
MPKWLFSLVFAIEFFNSPKFELRLNRARLHDSFGKGEDKLPADLLTMNRSRDRIGMTQHILPAINSF